MTKFEEIYELNEIMKNDGRLIGKPSNQIYSLQYKYLKYAISLFESDCYKDLNKMTPFFQQEYYFISDGIDNEYLLSPVSPNNCNFYVGYRVDENVNYMQIIDYAYDSDTHVLTINETIPNSAEVYVSGYIIGSFEEDLNIKEQEILAEGMLVPYLKEQVNKQSLLNQMVYGDKTNRPSQANHIKEVKDVSTTQLELVESMINKYTIKYTTDNLLGLGGGLI